MFFLQNTGGTGSSRPVRILRFGEDMGKDLEYTDAASPLANTYSRFPVTLVKGLGARLWDDRGREYVDFAAGIAVCSLGHCHPGVTRAMAEQAATLVHVSNLYWTRPQWELATRLVELSFADKVFFCNSGAESVEAAIKLARRYAHTRKGPDCYEIICLEGSFHGRTVTTVSATGQPAFRFGFEPLTPGFVHVPPGNVQALRLAAGRRTAAVLIEPIQGEGGVRPVSDEFLLAAREICDGLDALLVFDEVQVGMGRTGSLFAYEQTPVVPDVMCLAKALGNGLPIGAMLAREDVMSHLPPGSHASTFGGNPVACAASKVVVDTISSPGFLEEVARKGEFLFGLLDGLAGRYPGIVKEVRGRGLIQAVELREPRPGLALELLDRGFLVLLSRDRILRMVPPLVIGEDEIRALAGALDEIFRRWDIMP